MNLAPIDWAIVGTLVAVLFAAALYTRQFATSVSGFLAANRCAGRYLISVAFNMAQLGVITLVWYFQQNYDVGYTSIWWQLLEGPALIVMALTGWVIYRFRRTRALTLAQFFEMRYSKRFRVFAGVVAFVSGIINYGIFPGVAARYFIALCGFPEHVVVFGQPMQTFVLFMMALMGTALTFVFLGGQVAVMVTDFLQGVFSNLVFIAVMAFLLWTIPWEHIADTLLGRVWEGHWVADGVVRAPVGRSMIHPFKLQEEERFNVWYWVISVVVMFYGMRAWQGDQGYNAAARNAHEARMANILNGWRFRVLMLIVVVLPICIRTLMHHPAYVDPAVAVNGAIDAAQVSDAVQAELRTPYATAALLPAGLLGLMCAAMLGAFISTNDTYLHSWAAIFIQDVVLPFRKRPLGTREHLWLLKGAIFGVAVFAILFSSYYKPNQYIAMYLALTGAVFVGGAGSAIIGGLYWDRGTTAAAWTAMLLGMSLSAFGIIVKNDYSGGGAVDPLVRFLEGGREAWWSGGAGLCLYVRDHVTGQEMTFVAIAASLLSYVVVSLCGRTRFDMDRLLHRGIHEVEEDRVEQLHEQPTWLQKLGFTSEYTGRDRWVAFITLSWPLVWTAIFVAVTIYNFQVEVSDESWLAYWRVWTWVVWWVGLAVMVWFTIGGFVNLRDMFRSLKAAKDDASDDGMVR